MPTIAVDFTHEFIDVAVNLSMPAGYFTRILDRVAQYRGYPEAIRADPESDRSANARTSLQLIGMARGACL